MGLFDIFKPHADAAVSADELRRQLGSADAPMVLDVRSADEFASGHIAGAMNIPHDQLSRRHGELAAFQTRPVVICCRSGMRAGIAARVLRQAGFTHLRMLSGHMQDWCGSGRPVTTGR